MSTDVKIIAVRREDHCPFEIVWIGGVGVYHDLTEAEKEALEATVIGTTAIPFPNWECVKSFVAEHKEAINRYTDFDVDDMDAEGDDYAYWLVVET